MGFLLPCLLLFLHFQASFLNYLAQGQGERCGSQFGGRVCDGGRCCSGFGYCGSTPNYCELGCQSHCTDRCGIQNGGALCQGGRCCSRFGFCGSTPDHCNEGCQSQCTVERCGVQGGGALCRHGRCCSQFGYCGSTPAYCGGGCQSQCNGGVVSNISSSLFDELLNISSSQFDEFLKHRNDRACPGKNFYTYDAFLAATHSFNGFATTGDSDTQKREIAAFFAQTSIGRCGDEPTISFKTALSFWMTSQSPKPSCHDVISGKWMASTSDKAVGRVPGFGLITNIMSGGVECQKGRNSQVVDRIGFYKRYCDILGVSYGDNLDCYSQSPWVG